MPKILIVCDVYPPSFAPRMGYLVKYMKEWNWAADVVTRGQDSDHSFQSLLGNERVIRVHGIKIPMKTKKDKVLRLIKQKNHHIQRGNLISNHRLNNLNSKDYKLILCSTANRTYMLDAAFQVAKEWELPWIADIRDLEEQKPKIDRQNTSFIEAILNKFQKSYHNFSINKRNIRFSNANTLITISPWHVDQIKKYNSKTLLIFNGYDPDTYFTKKISNKKSFNITYTGTVHFGRHDPELLFQATKKLKENNIINKANFRIQFYVPLNWRKNITNSETYFDIKEFVDFYDYIDTSKVPQLLNESAVLLLLSNLLQPEGPKGLISTTKYFEYLFPGN